jgi:hypothetical protein
MGEVFTQLLRPAGMAAARAALVDNYEWFTHASRMDAFERIKEEGLQPRNPGCPTPTEVGQILGSGSDNILCLQPYPKKGILNLARDAPLFKMAVSRDFLPRRIGVDWSFGPWRETLCNIRSAHPDWPIERVLLEHVRRYEFLASYDEIPASALRVCPNSAPDSSPCDWPEMMHTRRETAHQLLPDVLGNIQV